MWCPTCGAEYRGGIHRCADCGTDLVDTLPTPPSVPRDPRPSVTGPFSPDDDVVELTTTTAMEAEVTAAHLRSEGIDAVVFGVDPYSGYGGAFQNAQGARIMVRRGDVKRAAPFVSHPVDRTSPLRSARMRGVALLVLLLVATPVAASFPLLLPVAIVIGVLALATRLVRRPTRTAQ